MASPFPHIAAKVAADLKKSQEAKKTDGWDIFWSGCWRAGILIMIMIVVTVGHQTYMTHPDQRLHLNWDRIAPTIVRHEPANTTNTSGRFFLDIVMSHEALKSSQGGLLMEKKGWSGVCAGPFGSQSDLGDRSCRLVAQPVGPTDGAQVKVSDCSHSSFGANALQSLMNKFTQAALQCHEATKTAVSITTLLHITSAPKVVDYISLDTHGTELAILKSFPFAEHCVRAWSITARKEDAVHDLKQVLEVGQGCRVKSSGEHSVFARCPCDKADRKPHAAPATRDDPDAKSVEILPSGKVSEEKLSEKRRKGASDSAASELNVDK